MTHIVGLEMHSHPDSAGLLIHTPNHLLDTLIENFGLETGGCERHAGV